MYTLEEVSSAIEGEKLSESLYKMERFAQSHGLIELEKWCHCELNGYENISGNDRSMQYRKVSVQWRDIYNRPIMLSPEVQNDIGRIPIANGVLDFEASEAKGSGWAEKEFISKLSRAANVRFSSAWIPPEQITMWLSKIRGEARRRLHDAVPRKPQRNALYPMPDFASMVPDALLVGVLQRRWIDANNCFEAHAYLSTVIMLGSILEGVLLSKIEQDRPTACRAVACPKIRGTTTPLPIHEWTLQSLIDVCHECGWLRSDVKHFIHALREYRNFVHPNKERQEGITFDVNTARIAWEVVSAALTA